jgi:hypothetical protein
MQKAIERVENGWRALSPVVFGIHGLRTVAPKDIHGIQEAVNAVKEEVIDSRHATVPKTLISLHKLWIQKRALKPQSNFIFIPDALTLFAHVYFLSHLSLVEIESVEGLSVVDNITVDNLK